MNNYFLVVPLVAALGGFAATLVLRTVILRRLPLLIRQVGKAAGEMLSIEDILAKLSSQNNFSDISPVVDAHMDEFLQHRLGKAMPMVGMFIGEKTISQLKTIFMKELEELFPLVMDKYTGNLASRFNLSSIISQKTENLPSAALQKIRKSVSFQIRWLPVGGLLAGLAIGLIQLFVLWLTGVF